MISVFVLHRHPAAMRKLSAHLAGAPGMRLAGTADGIFEARRRIAESEADLLLSALRLADGNAAALLHALRLTAVPDQRPPKVLLLAPAADDGLLLDAMRAGADGYHVCGDPSRSLCTAIAETMRDEAVMAPVVARHMLAYFGADVSRPQPLQLTASDRDLLLRLERGSPASRIAREAGLPSPGDVRRRIRHLYRKMQWDLRAGMRTVLA